MARQAGNRFRVPPVASLPAGGLGELVLGPDGLAVYTATGWKALAPARPNVGRFDVVGHSLSTDYGASNPEYGAIRNLVQTINPGARLRIMSHNGAVLGFADETPGTGATIGGIIHVLNELRRDEGILPPSNTATVIPGNTTLSGTHTANGVLKTLTLAAASTFENGQRICYGSPTNNECAVILSGGGTTSLILDRVLAATHASGESVWVNGYPYVPRTQIGLVSYGFNDNSLMGPGIYRQQPFKNALRAAIACLCQSVRFQSAYGGSAPHSSVVYTGWSHLASTNVNYGDTFTYSGTIGNSFVINIPSDFPGGAVDLHWVAGSGVGHGGHATIAVSGSTTQSTFVDTRDPIAPVLVATTANISLTGEQTLDGVLTSASRVLVKNQTTASQNGVYVTAAGAWARATDADIQGELSGNAVNVLRGTTLAGNSYRANVFTTLGTDAVTWTLLASEPGRLIPQGDALPGVGFSGHHVIRLTGLNSGRHAITVTTTAVMGVGIIFNGYGIEASPLPPLVMVAQENRPATFNSVPVGYLPRHIGLAITTTGFAAAALAVPITPSIPAAGVGVPSLRAGDTVKVGTGLSAEYRRVAVESAPNTAVSSLVVSKPFTNAHANAEPVVVGNQDWDLGEPVDAATYVPNPESVNSIIRDVVTEFASTNVVTFTKDDVLLKNADLFASDGIHYNDLGHVKVGQKMATVVRDQTLTESTLINSNVSDRRTWRIIGRGTVVPPFLNGWKSLVALPGTQAYPVLGYYKDLTSGEVTIKGVIAATVYTYIVSATATTIVIPSALPFVNGQTIYYGWDDAGSAGKSTTISSGAGSTTLTVPSQSPVPTAGSWVSTTLPWSPIFQLEAGYRPAFDTLIDGVSPLDSAVFDISSSGLVTPKAGASLVQTMINGSFPAET